MRSVARQSRRPSFAPRTMRWLPSVATFKRSRRAELMPNGERIICAT